MIALSGCFKRVGNINVRVVFMTLGHGRGDMGWFGCVRMVFLVRTKQIGIFWDKKLWMMQTEEGGVT